MTVTLELSERLAGRALEMAYWQGFVNGGLCMVVLLILLYLFVKR
jgi:hypothetical protein